MRYSAIAINERHQTGHFFRQSLIATASTISIAAFSTCLAGGSAKADGGACGPPSNNLVICQNASYGDITYTAGTRLTLILNNDNMVVNGTVAVSTTQTSGNADSEIDLNSFQRINGTVSSTSAGGQSLVYTYDGLVDGKLVSTSAGQGNVSVTLSGTEVVGATNSTLVEALHNGNGDSFIILQQSPDQSTSSISVQSTGGQEAVAAHSKVTGFLSEAKITMNGGMVTAQGANSVGLFSEAGEGEAYVKVSAGNISSDGTAIRAITDKSGLNGHATIEIGETNVFVGRPGITGLIEAQSRNVDFFFNAGMLAHDGAAVVRLEAYGINVQTGPKTLIESSGVGTAGLEVIAQSATVSMDTPDFRANTLNAKSILLKAAGDGARFSLDSNAADIDALGVGASAIVLDANQKKNVTFEASFERGEYSVDASSKAVIEVIAADGTNATLNFKGASIEPVDSARTTTGNVVLISAPQSAQGASVTLNIATHTEFGWFDNTAIRNTVDSSGFQLNINVEDTGFVRGNTVLGGGASTFTMNGGSFDGTIYGDYDPFVHLSSPIVNTSNDHFVWNGGDITGSFRGQDGSDQVTVSLKKAPFDIEAFTFDGGNQNISVQRDVDVFTFQSTRVLKTIDANKIVNFEKLILDDSTVSISQGTLFLYNYGQPLSYDYGDLILRNNSQLTYMRGDNTDVLANIIIQDKDSAFIALGHGQISAGNNVFNSGTISLKNGVADGLFFVAGNYTGNGGFVSLDVDFSRATADTIVLSRNISGNTTVQVAPHGTVTYPQAIPIIRTNLPPSPSAFSLQNGHITVGAYTYNLTLEGQNFYLSPASGVSSLSSGELEALKGTAASVLADAGVNFQPYIPLYEAYQSALLEMTRLPSLKTRSGGRYEGGAALSSGPAPDAVWGRTGGGFAHFDPQSSTTGYDYDMSSFDIQAGLDGLFLDSADGALVGGLTAHYRTGEAKVHSRYGDSKLHPDGYGIGGTLTWFGADGFYADAQGELTWYSSELKAENLPFAPEDSDAFGYALSLEAGQAFGIGDGIALTPQAQLSFASVEIDSFTGAYSDHVSFSDGESLLARAGLAVSRESAWQDVNGEARSANIYGLANLYYEFLGKTTATVTQALDFSSEPDDFTGEIGFGGSIDWQAGKLRYSAFAEVTASTGFDTGSYGYGGNVGLKVRF
ncbi:autotransporter outer membrane beta-barrel domain-containing protein [Martelella lutilitoris]|uniref:Autotransporter outer membrane beta-barrel domain-containing protein n=1 Tax=Martelella lutilitoris TaxID=2583532 RepID=A0A7T7HML4_9HYPH|nr:autotransporter outer membrane beta-barrel domain-containing protein [Martelella lutilitoris]QQM31904.1 autotransporter outer membrane beta-barrel domain-containing protein [Martelella lutilitoris]